MDSYDERDEERRKMEFKPDFESPFHKKIYEHLHKTITGMAPNELSDNLKKSNIADKVSIPFLGGRPDRELVINGDDILNLQIALETSKTIKEFCLVV
jgi:hypothetical protein